MTEDRTVVFIEKINRFSLRVDGQEHSISVDPTIYTHFTNQFKNNTEDQKKRKATLFKLMEAAYRQGYSDGRGENSPP